MRDRVNTDENFRQFLAVMQSRNLSLTPGKQLIADGQWHRCDVTNKTHGNNDGSYVLYTDGPVPWGLYQNWTDGKDPDYWRGDRDRQLADAELEELDRRMEETRVEAERQAAEMAARAAERAKELWDRAKEASPDHPYLKQKKIKPHGVRVDECDRLLVPMYSPDGELVNLQLIDDEGSKCFLRRGRAKGCWFEITGQGGTVIAAEGFATAATIYEATGATVIAAFSASNLVSVADLIRSQMHRESLWENFLIAADDDWKTKDNPGVMKGLAAARVATALIAIPKFGKDRGDSQTDFNDLSVAFDLDAVKEDIERAVGPQILLEQKLVADPHSAHSDVMIGELAAWKRQDPVIYERLLAKLKKTGVRIRDLDSAIKNKIREDAAKEARERARKPPVEQVDVEALAKSAAEIIASKNVLDLFAEAHDKIFVGAKNSAKLLYLICTSRLFGPQETMHGAVKGTSSVGKSALLSSVKAFMPPEVVVRFTSLTEKALLYLPDGGDLSHKILVMAEASKDEKQQEFQNLMLRELMSEGVLRHLVPQKNGDKWETVTIEVKGPVAFLVSTTKNELDAENETRMLSLEMDDSAEQTKKVMGKIAKREGWNLGAEQVDFTPWHDYQRLLSTGERRVYVPFALQLAELIPPRAVRLRRDFGQLIRAIKAHALLNREQRDRSDIGEIWATLADYAAVLNLMVDPMSESAEVKMLKGVAATIAAVKKLLEECAGEGGVKVRQVADALKLDRSTAQRHLRRAVDDGFLVNLEQRKGHFARYDVADEVLKKGTALLPTVEQLREAYCDDQERRDDDQTQKSSLRDPPKTTAHLHTASEHIEI